MTYQPGLGLGHWTEMAEVGKRALYKVNGDGEVKYWHELKDGRKTNLEKHKQGTDYENTNDQRFLYNSDTETFHTGCFF